MSILFNLDNSILISHKQYVDLMLKDIDFPGESANSTFELNEKLFQYDVSKVPAIGRKKKRKFEEVDTGSETDRNKEDYEMVGYHYME